LKSHLAPASSKSLLLQTECPPSLLHSTSPPGSTTTATSHRIQKFSQTSPLYRISSWQAIVSSPAMTRTHTWKQPWKSPRKYKSIQPAHTCFIIQTCHSALSKQHKRNFSSTHSRSCPQLDIYYMCEYVKHHKSNSYSVSQSLHYRNWVLVATWHVDIHIFLLESIVWKKFWTCLEINFKHGMLDWGSCIHASLAPRPTVTQNHTNHVHQPFL